MSPQKEGMYYAAFVHVQSVSFDLTAANRCFLLLVLCICCISIFCNMTGKIMAKKRSITAGDL